MNLNIKGIKSYSAQRLSENKASLFRAVMIYALVLAGAQALSMILGKILLTQADKMTGLSASGIRTILMSAQQVMRLLVGVLAPLWQVGYLLSCLDVSRGKAANPQRLTYGIRHAGKYMLCYLLVALRVFLRGYLAMILGAFALSFFLSGAVPLDPAVIDTQDPAAMEALTSQVLTAIRPMLIPAFILMLALACLVILPMLYRYRLMIYLAADHPELRPGQVLRLSDFLMRGVRLQYLKLDLSYWWFYLLLGLAEAVPAAVFALPYLNLTLPIRDDWFFIILQFLYLALLTVISLLFYNRVQVTYAAAYDHLSQARLPDAPVV